MFPASIISPTWDFDQLVRPDGPSGRPRFNTASAAPAGSPANPSAVSAEQTLGGDRVDVTLAGTLRFRDDVLAHFDCGLALANRHDLEVTGDEGSLLVTDPWHCRKPGIQLRRNGQDDEWIGFEPVDSYRLEAENLSGLDPRGGGAAARPRRCARAGADDRGAVRGRGHGADGHPRLLARGLMSGRSGLTAPRAPRRKRLGRNRTYTVELAPSGCRMPLDLECRTGPANAYAPVNAGSRFCPNAITPSMKSLERPRACWSSDSSSS